MNDITPDDLQFQEFAEYVNRALRHQGFTEMRDAGDADVAIFLSDGIGEPRVVQYEQSYPIYGRVSSGGTTTASANTYSSNGEYSRTNITVNEPSRYGVVGVGTQTVTDVSYDRYIELTAIDTIALRETNDVQEAWRTTISSTGSIRHLRRTFPVILAGALPYVGRNSGSAIEVELRENHPLVHWMKTGRAKSR